MKEQPYDPVLVYIVAQIADGGYTSPCKVGIANSVKRRLKEFQTASPFRLGVFKTYQFPCRTMALEVEALYHHMQKDNRLVGEWFNLEPSRAAAFMNLYIELALMAECPDFTDDEGKLIRQFIYDEAVHCS